jgi:hypothetical protein
MREIEEAQRHLPEAKRLELAQKEFSSAAEAVSAANRAARGAGQYLTDELTDKAKALDLAQQQLGEAEAEFDRAIGEPKPVKITGIVRKKLRETFATELQDEAISTLKTGLTFRLPFVNTTEKLERVRLAVIKLAGGDLTQLRRHVEIAKVDWRDVISAAEHPEAFSIGLSNYTNLDEKVQKEIEARDRQQYVSWLGKPNSLSLWNIISKLPRKE